MRRIEWGVTSGISPLSPAIPEHCGVTSAELPADTDPGCGTARTYTGVFKIENDAGWTRLSVYWRRHVSSHLAGLPTREGLSIIVYEPYDRPNDVTVSNTMGTVPEATGSPAPTIPEYQPGPGYVSPAGTASGSTPVTGGSAGLPLMPNPTSVAFPVSTSPVTPSLSQSPSPALTEGNTATPTGTPETTAQSPYSESTPKSPFGGMLVICAIVIAGFGFVSINIFKFTKLFI